MRKHAHQIAHLWVEHNTGETVKPFKKNTGQGSNFYWDDDTIYSYGRHFPIASFIETGKGKAVVFTRRTYSVTTGGHISAVRQALHGRPVPVFYVSDVRDGAAPRSKEERDYFAGAIEANFKAAGKARTHAGALCAAVRRYVEEGNALAAYFNFEWRLTVPEGLEDLEGKADGYKVKAQAALERKNAAAVAFEHVSRAAWIKGEDLERPKGLGALPWGVEKDLPTLLRLVGDTVETSRGAVVPLADVVKGLAFLDSLQGGYYSPIPGTPKPRLGAFTLDSVGLDGSIKAGCHVITKAELDRFRAVLKAEGRA